MRTATIVSGILFTLCVLPGIMVMTIRNKLFKPSPSSMYAVMVMVDAILSTSFLWGSLSITLAVFELLIPAIIAGIISIISIVLAYAMYKTGFGLVS